MAKAKTMERAAAEESKGAVAEMIKVELELPADFLYMLPLSRMPARELDKQVRTALAIQLFQEGVISLGKAAELAGESRARFETFLWESGIPVVKYTETEYRQDREAIESTIRC